MQAASARTRGSAYLPFFQEGFILLLSIPGLISPHKGYFVSPGANPRATPFELLALLLFQSPFELTYLKLLLLFADRNHQFEAQMQNETQVPII